MVKRDKLGHIIKINLKGQREGEGEGKRENDI